MCVCEEVHIRLGSFVDGAGVTANFNCIEYTLEMREMRRGGEGKGGEIRNVRLGIAVV